MFPPTDVVGQQNSSAAPRSVFFVSDGTGVTVETLGHSLLSQFEGLTFSYVIIPFVNSRDNALEAVRCINAEAARSGQRPIVFSSLVDEGVRDIVGSSQGVTLDFFAVFLGPLEEALGTGSSHVFGRAHGMRDSAGYLRRIDAVHFALAADDGLNTDRYDDAQIILVGISRVGKTPTAIYLALQYGLFVANYPLDRDDLTREKLPPVLAAYRDRLVGLTVDPARLVRIRSERRPGGEYADPRRVRREVEAAEMLMRANEVPILDSTSISVEEIAASILYRMELVPALP